MGSLWRSEEMQLIQLFVQYEAAHDTVDQLGQLGLVQFKDLNTDKSAFQRNFANDVKRCDELERKLRFIAEQVESAGIATKHFALQHLKVGGSELELRNLDQARFDEIEKELKHLNENQEMLNRNFNELTEMRYVLEKGSDFFEETLSRAKAAPRQPEDLMGFSDDVEDRTPLVKKTEAPQKSATLGFIAGVIARDKRVTFERVMFRATRGNMFVRFSEIERPIADPHTGELLDKNVFIVFYSGERAHAKINKICEAFGANRYMYPDSRQELTAMLDQVRSRQSDLQVVIDKTNGHRLETLRGLSKDLPGWQLQVGREKAVYHTLNMFNYDVTRKCLIAEGWCPKIATDKIQMALREATEKSGAQVPSIVNVIQSHETPPTYFVTNKFTAAFQAIVDAYGIARYRELNPAVLSIVTFPFLFAIMFGDFGHGIILTLFAAYLVWNEKKIAAGPINEMLQMCFDGRYVLLLMGFFSIYTGLIYNDCFSLPINIFGSKYTFPSEPNPGDNFLKAQRTGGIYPVGFDPAWKNTMTQLPFVNSFKMKLSVILGVTQMCVGIIISYMNAKYFKLRKNILYEFIPQMIFMLSIFGYLCLMIIVKWCTDWLGSGRQPPDLIHVLIFMFLHPGTVEDGVFESNKPYSFQAALQVILLLAAFVAVPWMLLPKPLLLKKEHESGYRPPADHHGGGHDDHGGEFNFGEVMIHQMIHTIEFVLGAISNTASYLRLWALSLAHAELSEVFWDRVLMGQVISKEGAKVSPIAVFIAFAIWVAATVMVLLIMETLSAFLHALRLHWVEFMNKFYLGDGHKFMPFDYRRLTASEEGGTDE